MSQLHTYLHWGVNRYAGNTSKVLAHLVLFSENGSGENSR